MQRIPRCVSLVLISSIGLLVGCGDEWTSSRPKPVPVSGTVLHDGTPVEGATVIFAPAGHTYAAVGQTDAQGVFQLRTFEEGDGAVPGDYQVAVRKVEMEGAAAGDDDAEKPPSAERWLLPGKYGSPETSGIKITVPEDGQEDVKIELTGTPSKPEQRPAARSRGGGE